MAWASCGLALRRLDSNDLAGTERVVVVAFVSARQRVDADVEKIVGRLSLEQTVSLLGVIPEVAYVLNQLPGMIHQRIVDRNYAAGCVARLRVPLQPCQPHRYPYEHAHPELFQVIPQ
jgi:hypothetical protein